MEGAANVDRDILALIGEGWGGRRDDERFNALALRVFAYQFEHNHAYRGFCQGRGLTPLTVNDWEAIPAVPAMAFKEVALACFPVERAAAVYESSGTTGHRPSRHYLETLELYEASLAASFGACVLPDGVRPRMFVLGPAALAERRSSLGHMLEVLVHDMGAPGSRSYLDDEGLRALDLEADLRAAEAEGLPVCLLGTAFAFVHFIDRCRASGVSFSLPDGSRIMDTGGFKGKSREISQAHLYREYQELFGVPDTYVVNEYGMTELGSQFYDSSLVQPRSIRRKLAPPWVRTVIVDPETLGPQEAGRAGLLRHYDLANRSSVMAVQTEDVGIAIGDGFEVLGRAKGAEARGCSMAVDEMLSRT